MNAVETMQASFFPGNGAGYAQTISGSYAYSAIPNFEISEGRYTVRLARTTEEIDAALRLRFAVFNLELGEGLEASFLTGRDEDEFDGVCHHLICVEKESGLIVGTYRLQTLEMAQTAGNFYTSAEFEIEKLPAEVLAKSLEIGRACIAREHRHTRVLFLLWKGLAAYARHKDKRFFFGCCSLASQNAADGIEALRLIEREGFFHEVLLMAARENYVCQPDNFSINQEEIKIELPKLFLLYLRLGARVCSPPAIDRRFKTIDFLVLFDLETLSGKFRKMFR